MQHHMLTHTCNQVTVYVNARYRILVTTLKNTIAISQYHMLLLLLLFIAVGDGGTHYDFLVGW